MAPRLLIPIRRIVLERCPGRAFRVHASGYREDTMRIGRTAVLAASLLSILVLAGYRVNGPTAPTLTARPGTTLLEELGPASNVLTCMKCEAEGKSCCCVVSGGCA